MTTSTVAKKDIQKLQRAIVDGLEDVKAQDIQVFDTEHLSALFERVIIASGTSNRQTKALAGSVRDAVRDAGFPKPRVEGETNGEWIIVDCGQAVVHVMQPNFRQYYNLEELWGEKPVRLKFGAAKPTDKEITVPLKATKKVVEVEGNLRRSNAAKKGVAEAFPSKAQVKKTLAAKSAAVKVPAKKVAAKKAPAKATAVVAVKKVTVNAPVKTVAKKSAPKAPAKVAAKKAPARKTAVVRKA
ncbi:MAG: ribosome silencing factor [Burkholderiaceae bacterium]|nr:ribosome silencing factor [Burkholderiaceae bacterium]